MTRDYSETRIQISIVQWLQLKGFLYTSTGAGLVRSARTQMMMNRLGYQQGSPDLIVWCKNGTLNIECKRPSGFRWSNKLNRLVKDTQGGKQSEGQKKFEKRLERISGHKYIVVSCLDEVIKFIEENNIQPY